MDNKTKFKADGSIDKYKARLVVLGCKQKFGIDYVKTFALVAKMTTVSIIGCCSHERLARAPTRCIKRVFEWGSE